MIIAYRPWAIGLTLCIIAAAMAVQAPLAVNRDAAFYLSVGSQALGGRMPHFADLDQVLFGFVLSNFTLYLPPSALVAGFGLPFEGPLRLYILLLTAWPLWQAGRFCRRWEDRSPRVWLLPPVFAAITLVFPIDAFGQREQIFSLLILPYLLATILELEGLRTGPRSVAIAIGTAIALLIKPHFIPVWLAVEALRLVMTRRPLGLMDRFNLIIGGGHLLYYGLVLMQFRASGADPELIAWVLALKRGYLHKTMAELLIRKYSLLWPVALAAAALALARRSGRGGMLVWTMAFAGGMASAILQSLGVDYHWLVATVMAAMMVTWGVVVVPPGKPAWAALAFAVLFAGLAGLRLNGTLASERTTARQIEVLTTAIAAAHSPSPSLIIVNGDYGPLYPVLGQTGFTNGSSYQSFWFLDVMAAQPSLRDSARPDWLDAIAATTARDISDRKPGLVLIAEEPRPEYAPILDDPRVKTALASYQRAGTAGTYRLLRRTLP